MGRGRVVLAVVAAALVCAGGASAASGWTEVTIQASDATPLACAYIVPSGTAPAGGWPGVILFHGLGQSHTDMEPYGSALAQFGFAALACDARGTGASGGKFGLDGPRDVQDAQDLFSWFAARNDVSDTQIGAFGQSLGGGEVLNAAVAGVPFKAIVPVVGWTDLGQALNPNGVPKVGLLNELLQVVPASQWDPSLGPVQANLLGGTVSTAVKNIEAARSSRSKLGTLHVPTFLLQGRHDFLFDMDQAIAAYKLLAGPKRLYLGDIGHAPAKNPSAEGPTYLTEVLGWFDEYLAGGPKVNGGVELAHDPWDGTTSRYKSLPRTRHESVSLPGRKTLETISNAASSATRSVRLTGGPSETFGDGSVTVRYSGQSNYGWLIASVAVKGSATPVTFGAARLNRTKPSGTVHIPLSDQAVFLPRGKRLVVTVGRGFADGVYTSAVAGANQVPPIHRKITIRGVTLKLSLLKRAVSK
ncbi:MAG TPA: CocE/NonD family hydrolase [Gaiellaceae bacterium]|jgi:dienelactone hydrolase